MFHREELGLKIKRIIDFGRILYMKEKLNLKSTKLVYYIEKEETLENVLLIGMK